MFAFEASFGGGLGATYAVHLRLIGKLVVDFLLVIIELFSLGVTAEVLGPNVDWKSPFLKGVDRFVPNFRYKGTSRINHSSSRKTRCVDLQYGIRM